MGIERLLQSNRSHILELAARHGARNVRVFGSFARGEAGPDSDIDFLVECGPHTSPFFPGGLLMDLEELLGRKVDIVTERGLHPYLRDKILREAIAL
jgi:predicted nucleotidyltransferase